MRGSSRVNWSEVIRRAIQDRVPIEERKRDIKKLSNPLEIRNGFLRSQGPTDYDSIGMTKMWRNLRK